MNSSLTSNDQLIKLAKKINAPLNAVYSKDQLYHVNPEPGGYIINMEDIAEGDGSHWVAIYFDVISPIGALYFDSFGVDPPIAIMDFMKRWSDKCIVSTKEVQNINSGFCGQYCLLFLKEIHNSKGSLYNRYNKFLKQFKQV